MNEMVSYTPELLPVERVTGGVMGIDSNHAQIHAGESGA